MFRSAARSRSAFSSNAKELTDLLLADVDRWPDI
jgi:hypothetical protein